MSIKFEPSKALIAQQADLLLKNEDAFFTEILKLCTEETKIDFPSKPDPFARRSSLYFHNRQYLTDIKGEIYESGRKKQEDFRLLPRDGDKCKLYEIHTETGDITVLVEGDIANPNYVRISTEEQAGAVIEKEGNSVYYIFLGGERFDKVRINCAIVENTQYNSMAYVSDGVDKYDERESTAIDMSKTDKTTIFDIMRDSFETQDNNISNIVLNEFSKIMQLVPEREITPKPELQIALENMQRNLDASKKRESMLEGKNITLENSGRQDGIKIEILEEKIAELTGRIELLINENTFLQERGIKQETNISALTEENTRLSEENARLLEELNNTPFNRIKSFLSQIFQRTRKLLTTGPSDERSGENSNESQAEQSKGKPSIVPKVNVPGIIGLPKKNNDERTINRSSDEQQK